MTLPYPPVPCCSRCFFHYSVHGRRGSFIDLAVTHMHANIPVGIHGTPVLLVAEVPESIAGDRRRKRHRVTNRRYIIIIVAIITNNNGNIIVALGHGISNSHQPRGRTIPTKLSLPTFTGHLSHAHARSIK